MVLLRRSSQKSGCIENNDFELERENDAVREKLCRYLIEGRNSVIAIVIVATATVPPLIVFISICIAVKAAR